MLRRIERFSRSIKNVKKPTDWSDGIQSQREDTDVISKFSVKRPYTVIVGVILVIVLGVVSFTRMTTDLLPDMNLPYALVITTDVGASRRRLRRM